MIKVVVADGVHGFPITHQPQVQEHGELVIWDEKGEFKTIYAQGQWLSVWKDVEEENEDK